LAIQRTINRHGASTNSLRWKVIRMLSFKAIKLALREWNHARKVRGKTKFFCIGRNKTGTTSLQVAFKELGFIVGRQRPAEILYDQYYYRGEFGPIIEY